MLTLHYHLATLIVGVIGMGFAEITFADALISERHSAGTELIILMGKKSLLRICK